MWCHGVAHLPAAPPRVAATAARRPRAFSSSSLGRFAPRVAPTFLHSSNHHAAAESMVGQQRQRQQQRWQRGATRPAATAAPAPAPADEGSAGGAAMAPVPAGAVGLSLSELWQLLQHDRRRLVACIAVTFVSVATAMLVAPSLGRVVDIISRGSAATPRELGLAVGRLGAVYVVSNTCLAVQVCAPCWWRGRAVDVRCRCTCAAGMPPAAASARPSHVAPALPAASCTRRWPCRWRWARGWRTACAAACLARCCRVTRCSLTKCGRARWLPGWARTWRSCRWVAGWLAGRPAAALPRCWRGVGGPPLGLPLELCWSSPCAPPSPPPRPGRAEHGGQAAGRTRHPQRL